MLNQSTTHCYFGDRDVHAMGTCSATLNDDRGGVCTRGCLNEPLPLPCGCTKMKEPLRRESLIHEIPHPNTLDTSSTARGLTGHQAKKKMTEDSSAKDSSTKKRAVPHDLFGNHPRYHHHADQGSWLVHKKRNGLELIPARRWWTTGRRRTNKIRSRT